MNILRRLPNDSLERQKIIEQNAIEKMTSMGILTFFEKILGDQETTNYFYDKLDRSSSFPEWMQPAMAFLLWDLIKDNPIVKKFYAGLSIRQANEILKKGFNKGNASSKIPQEIPARVLFDLLIKVKGTDKSCFEY